MLGELIGALICLILVLAVGGLACYGIVALGGRLFRRSARRIGDLGPCVFCGRTIDATQGRCEWCGRDLRGELGAELLDLEALQRQLARFCRSGTLEGAAVQNLLGQVSGYRRALLERAGIGPAAAHGAPVRAPGAEAAAEKPLGAELVEQPLRVVPPERRAVPAKPAAPRPLPVPHPRPAPPLRPVPQPTPAATGAAAPLPAAAAVPKPAIPPPPPAPRRSWAEMLAGFMQERNIRWVELIGGLLIVSSSVALVLSLWQTLSGYRYFQYIQFGIFVVATLAVLGAGLYAQRRWRLETTSRGLLVIGGLLMPLDFLFLALSSSSEPDAITVAAGLAGLAALAWPVAMAGRVLVPEGRFLQAAAVLGGSAAVLVLGWCVPAEARQGWLVAAGCLPVGIFAAAVGAYLYGFGPRQRIDVSGVAALLTLAGTGGFGMLAALGLLVSRAGGLRGPLDWLALPVALAAAPILACGMTASRKTVRDASLAGYQTAGTAIALLGAAGMLVALGLAWPSPLGIIAVGGLCCGALVWAAFYYGMPILHAGAIACGALAYLAAFHVVYPSSELTLLAVGGDLGRKMLSLTIGASSGTALGGLFVVLALVAEWLSRHGRRRHGVIYLGGCGVAAAAGLLLVTIHGVKRPPDADALRAMALYALYGTGSLALAGRWRRTELSYLGLLLVTAASGWLTWWQQGGQVEPVWGAVLAGEALVMGIVAAALGRRIVGPAIARSDQSSAMKSGRLVELYRLPLSHVAEGVGLAALAIGAATGLAARHAPAPVASAACLGGLWLLLAWMYRSAGRTWAGSLVLLAGLVHTLWLNYGELIAQGRLSLVVALLGHSSLAVAAAMVLDIWSSGRPDRRLAEDIGQVFCKPLVDVGLFSSILAVPVLAVELPSGTMPVWSLALCLFWLAVIWLAAAWRNREPRVMAAHQAVLALAVLVAVAAWLRQPQPWVRLLPRDLLLHPQSLQAYGIALGVLSLVWIAVRIALREREAARGLLSPYGPAVDRIVRHAVVWLQLLLVVWHMLPALGCELLPRLGVTSGARLATGGAAWALLAVMVTVMAVTLWYRWRVSMTSSLLLAATAPWLVAAGFAAPAEQAAASALRWGLATCFVICSLAVWQRGRLLRFCAAAGAKADLGPGGPRAARAALLAAMAAPVLLLTILAAAIQFGGLTPGGPAAGSFFHRLGPNVSYVIPLLLVMTGLVGHAVRERSAGYAFSAGLVAELAVVLGYALYVATGGDRVFDTTEIVTLIQLATIAAAVWAAAWLAVRTRLDVWRQRADARGPEPQLATGGSPRADRGGSAVLMSLQLAMPIGGNVLLLVAALVSLALVHPVRQDWVVAAGLPLGWVALVSTVGAYAYRQGQAGRRMHPQLVGLIGMAAMGLLACSVRGVLPQWGHGPEWGYRTLMLGWAAYALLIVLATWWVATVRTLPDAQGPPQALIRAAAVWVRIAGIAAVLLGLKAALFHEREQLWAAAAIATAAAAGATMAVWRRREGWAFSAASGVNLAASLAVWHFQETLDFEQWWVRLVQANLIASSAVALVWLAARRRLYRLRELRLGHSPLLAAQTAIPAVANCILLSVPVVWLAVWPADLPEWARRLLPQMADAPGWLGLALAAAAAGWYLWHALPGNLLHVLGGLVLGSGALLACRAAEFGGRLGWFDWEDRPEYHALTIAWAAAGILLLGVGLLGRRLRLAAEASDQDAAGAGQSPAAQSTQLVFPSDLVLSWVTAVGLLVVLLAVIHCPSDPTSPWLSGWAILAVSLMAGVLGVWLRRGAYVFISGLLLNVIGVVAWIAWAEPAWQLPPIAALVQANVLCLGVASAIWSVLGMTLPGGVPGWELAGRRVALSHAAARGAAGMLLAVAATAMVSHGLSWSGMLVAGRLDWIALAVAAAAVTICLWDHSSRLAVGGLYGLGLSAVGMGFCAQATEGRQFCHDSAVGLAAFVLTVAVLGVLVPRLRGLWRALGIPLEGRRLSSDWIVAAQAMVTAVVAAMSVWISLDEGFEGLQHAAPGWLAGRAVGPLAVALLLPAAILLAGRGGNGRRRRWQHASLGLGLLILAEAGFVWLIPQGGPSWIWLHRSVVLMVAAVAMTLVAGLALRRILPVGSDWIQSGRRITPWLGGLAMLALAAVLVEEGLRFDLATGTPMAWPAIVVVGVALAGLIAACLGFAVRPDWDPLGLDERQRQLYVYTAELLGGLIGLHIWFVMPWLFTRGLVRRYWMLIAMGVALIGAGLSEWFHRRRMPVLSMPLGRTALLLPAAPAVGYWFMKATGAETWFLGHASPATWFLIALFYGLMAKTRRSIGLGVLAVLAGNTGLWVMWDRLEIGILEHPQMWLIPLALVAIVAEQLNRQRLDKTQAAAVRYLALGVIYASSTADMFIAGVGEDFVTPLVLAVLAVLGALAGILLRIRSFLYLGVAFLVLDIVTLVGHAAIQPQTRWILWVCLIALGVAVLVLAAVFEKLRNDILAAVERFKDWEG